LGIVSQKVEVMKKQKLRSHLNAENQKMMMLQMALGPAKPCAHRCSACDIKSVFQEILFRRQSSVISQYKDSEFYKSDKGWISQWGASPYVTRNFLVLYQQSMGYVCRGVKGSLPYT
jgi:hypothetical protein